MACTLPSFSPSALYTSAPGRTSSSVILTALVRRLALFGEGARAFAGVVGAEDGPRQLPFEAHPVFQRHLATTQGGLLDRSHGQRSAFQDSARDRLGGGHQLCLRD